MKPTFTYEEVVNLKKFKNFWDFNFVDFIVTHVIVHEMMHSGTVNSLTGIDYHGDPDWVKPEGASESDRPTISGYEWKGVTRMQADWGNLMSLKNCDSFAYWVSFGRFWDHQYKANMDIAPPAGHLLLDEKEDKVPYTLDPPLPAEPAATKRKRRLFARQWID